jgi:UDP-3-O-[3-hydroxymyristoyl] glucosamine N-acyltransferase
VTFTLQELAALSGGELTGDGAQIITGAASLAEALPGEISFFENPKYMPLLRKTRASAVFVTPDFSEEIAQARIRVAAPGTAFQQIVLKLAPVPISFEPSIHPTAIVAPDVKLGARVSIQPYAVIEPGVTIGDDTVIGANSYVGHETTIGAGCLIYPLVTIRDRVSIGARVILHSGVVVGADGFGFVMKDGRHEKVPQTGVVQIDDDVEIGANTAIDRARFGRTWIKEGAKLDNLVHVAHNVIIGKHTAIAAQVGIAGSTRIGDYVMIGGQTGINGHIEIGDRNIIGGQTGVTKSLPSDGGAWWGTPATPLPLIKERLVWINRIPKLFARLKAIEEKLGL